MPSFGPKIPAVLPPSVAQWAEIIAADFKTSIIMYSYHSGFRCILPLLGCREVRCTLSHWPCPWPSYDISPLPRQRFIPAVLCFTTPCCCCMWLRMRSIGRHGTDVKGLSNLPSILPARPLVPGRVSRWTDVGVEAEMLANTDEEKVITVNVELGVDGNSFMTIQSTCSSAPRSSEFLHPSVFSGYVHNLHGQFIPLPNS